jgi:hypothetical protein
LHTWRLGLERADSAESAVDTISELIGHHGLTGEVSDTFPSVSVSMLICDRSEAWILEAAGKHFVAARVKSRLTEIEIMIFLCLVFSFTRFHVFMLHAKRSDACMAILLILSEMYGPINRPFAVSVPFTAIFLMFSCSCNYVIFQFEESQLISKTYSKIHL